MSGIDRKDAIMALYRIWLARGVGTRRNREHPRAIHVWTPSINEAESEAKRRFPHRIILNLERLEPVPEERHGVLI